MPPPTDLLLGLGFGSMAGALALLPITAPRKPWITVSAFTGLAVAASMSAPERAIRVWLGPGMNFASVAVDALIFSLAYAAFNFASARLLLHGRPENLRKYTFAIGIAMAMAAVSQFVH
jgi:hypothetical protein